MTNKRSWTTPNADAEFRTWSERLGGWGYQTTPTELRSRLFGIALWAGAIRDRIAWPFAKYGKFTGAQQGWRMFVRPQKYPGELHVDIFVEGRWQPLVRPWDPASTWRRSQRRHNRFRKLLGRFARTFYADRYTQTARWFARAAIADEPAATRVRVRLYRYRSAAPPEVLAGQVPDGRYEHERIFTAEELH